MEGRNGGRTQRDRQWKETSPRATHPCGCSPVNSDLSYLCDHRNLNLPPHAAAPRARLGVPSSKQSLSENRAARLYFQVPVSHKMYLFNKCHPKQLGSRWGLFNGSKSGETFPTFFVSVYVSIKRKKNWASYSSLHTQTEPRYIFGK